MEAQCSGLQGDVRDRLEVAAQPREQQVGQVRLLVGNVKHRRAVRRTLVQLHFEIAQPDRLTLVAGIGGSGIAGRRNA